MIKRRKIFLSIFLVILIIAAGFAYFKLANKEEQISYITETVRIGDIRTTVNASGQMGAVQLVNVGAQASGQIKKLHVELGQFVRRGDMIAEIDSTTQQNDLETSKARLESYQSQLVAKQVALRVAKTQLDREVQLQRSDSSSRKNLDDAENVYVTARAAVDELESQILQTRIALNTAETNLGYTKITAPLDGTIVSVPVEEGQTVNANQTTPTIVQIADLTNMEIKIEIAEGDITKVQPGMDVEYTILSEPGVVHKTTLHSIDPGLTTLSDGTFQKSAGSSTAIYYYANAIVRNDDGRLRIGMTTQNVISVKSAIDVVIVPNIAVFYQGGKPYVQIQKPGGQVEQRFIETGISDNMNIQVLSGLAAGDVVIATQMTKAEADAAANTPMRGPRRM